MASLGVVEEDLKPKTKEDFAGDFDDEIAQKKCVEYFEESRKLLMDKLLNKRKEIIKEEENLKKRIKRDEEKKLRASTKFQKRDKSGSRLNSAAKDKEPTEKIEPMVELELKLKVSMGLLGAIFRKLRKERNWFRRGK